MTDEIPIGEDAARTPSLWSTIRDAIRGSQEDLTDIPLGRAVILLAVPVVLEMSMESLLTIVDIFVVSRLGPDAVAAVGLTEGMLSPVWALAMGLSAAATALVARRIGEKDDAAAARAAVHAVFLSIVLACAFGVVGASFARELLGVMGATPGVISTGLGYTATMLGGSVSLFLLFVVNAVMRSAGDAAAAMRTLWLANVTNIVLAPILVFGVGPLPPLGVVGAAIAMTASRGLGVAYQGYVLVRGSSRLRIRAAEIVVVPAIVREVVRLAIPAATQVLIETASWLGLVRIVSTFGSLALAGYTIGMRIAIFALMPSWGLAQAAATLVGQSLGAKKPERARSAVLRIAGYNLAFLGPISIVLVAIPSTLIGVFANDAETLRQGADCLRIVGLGFVVFAVGMVMIQAFNGAGDTVRPMLVNLVAFWGFKLPAAFFLAKSAGMGSRGVYIAIAAAYTLQSIVAGILFLRGSWQTREVGGM